MAKMALTKWNASKTGLEEEDAADGWAAGMLRGGEGGSDGGVGAFAHIGWQGRARVQQRIESISFHCDCDGQLLGWRCRSVFRTMKPSGSRARSSWIVE